MSLEFQQKFAALMKAIQQKDKTQLAHLIAHELAPHPRFFINQGANAQPPLFAAIDTADTELVAMLLDAGADIEIKNNAKHTALYHVYLHNQLAMAQLLEARGADRHVKNKSGFRIVDVLIENGNLDLVKKWTAAGFDLQWANKDQTTTLHLAAASPTLEMLRFVAQHTHFSFSDTNKLGQRPSDRARQLEIFKYCLKQTPSLEANHSLVSGDYSIHGFARRGAKDIVEYLLQQGVDIQLLGKDGNSIIHNAVISQNRELAQMLLDKGADINARNRSGFCPIHFAAESGDMAMLEFLVERQAKINVQTNYTFIIRETQTPLYQAIKNRHHEVAVYLIQQGADVNTICNTAHATALTEACRNNMVETVEVLLKSGANPNGVNREPQHNTDPEYPEYYCFPLAQAQSAEVVNLLVAAGADIHAENRERSSALHYLAELERSELQTPQGQNKLQALKALIAHGANIQHQDMHGHTPLDKTSCSAVRDTLLGKNILPTDSRLP